MTVSQTSLSNVSEEEDRVVGGWVVLEVVDDDVKVAVSTFDGVVFQSSSDKPVVDDVELRFEGRLLKDRDTLLLLFEIANASKLSLEDSTCVFLRLDTSLSTLGEKDTLVA